jgi:exopolysaccharide biosynthesis WecB/TagA/CpsF family protein
MILGGKPMDKGKLVPSRHAAPRPASQLASSPMTGVFPGLGTARFVRLHVTPATAVLLIDLTPGQVAERLAQLLERPPPVGGPVTVAFMNMRNFVAARRKPGATDAFSAMDQIYPDGVGLQIARQLLGLPRFARVSGTDTVPLLLDRLPVGSRVFLLGGNRAVSAAAQAHFPQLFPRAILAGAHHGFFAKAEEAGVIAAIGHARPDVLLVGMGSPLQERWLARNRHRLPAKLAICVGGLVDYWAEELRRAPPTLREIGLEWLWILAQQPFKWRVYSVDAVAFAAALLHLKRLPSA